MQRFSQRLLYWMRLFTGASSSPLPFRILFWQKKCPFTCFHNWPVSWINRQEREYLWKLCNTSVGPRKILSPDRIWAHDLPNTGRVLYPLSFENSWRANSFNSVLKILSGRRFFLGPTHVLHYFHIYLPSCNFTIAHLSLFTICSLLNPVGGRRRMSYKNSV